MRTRRRILGGAVLFVVMGLSVSVPDVADASPAGKSYQGEFTVLFGPPTPVCMDFEKESRFNLWVADSPIPGSWFGIGGLWFASIGNQFAGITLTGVTLGADAQSLIGVGVFFVSPSPTIPFLVVATQVGGCA